MLKLLASPLIEFLKVFLIIRPLQHFSNTDFYDERLAFMRTLPAHSVGREMARMLDKNGLRLIPHYEEHDLKHLLLGYKMTTEDEIRMQAYLFGNGNRSASCLLFLSSGLLLPTLWNVLYEDYQKGKQAPSIYSLRLEDCLSDLTDDLRQKYVLVPQSRAATSTRNPHKKNVSSHYSPAVFS